MPQAQHAPTRVETHPQLLTTYAENGEVDLLMAGGYLVLSASEETPCGHNRVHASKVTLHFARRDAVDLRRKLDQFLRGTRRRGQWSETALASMAQEYVG